FRQTLYNSIGMQNKQTGKTIRGALIASEMLQLLTTIIHLIVQQHHHDSYYCLCSCIAGASLASATSIHTTNCSALDKPFHTNEVAAATTC
ncbi:hypothetical protein, partial [Klebsiella pneumoniae]|uniref:hypothetical protein n=1 Tax=Klebsiella pneumoniae TaxID=573 RepID=UPI0030137C7B